MSGRPIDPVAIKQAVKSGQLKFTIKDHILYCIDLHNNEIVSIQKLNNPEVTK